MKLVVSKKIIGFKSHLSFDGNSWEWKDNIDPDSFLWGFDHPRDLRDASKSLKQDIFFFEKTPWSRSQSYVVKEGNSISWSACIPSRVWKRRVREAATHLWRLFAEKDNSYYISTHVRNREVLEALERPAIDTAILSRRVEESNENNARALLKFKPDSQGLCPRLSYSLSSSVTGRMTISGGPNVLTMKKSDRKIFKSRHSDGVLVEIDISSAEPRVALSLFGKSIPGDVYTEVSKRAGMKMTREDAKIATLSALYGASHHTLKSRISNPGDSINLLETVKSYFGVHHIEKLIQEQHQELGYIKNTHGRKIFSDPPSLNHFIQSSAVDTSFDVFSSLLEKIDERGISATPIFLIHDAIGIDVKKSDLKALKEICKNGLESSTINTCLQVRLKEI